MWQDGAAVRKIHLRDLLHFAHLPSRRIKTVEVHLGMRMLDYTCNTIVCGQAALQDRRLGCACERSVIGDGRFDSRQNPAPAMEHKQERSGSISVCVVCD